MKRIAIVALSDLAADPRVNRQIRFLTGRYELTTIGLSPSGVDNVSFIPVPALHTPFRATMVRRFYLLTDQYDRHYWVQPISSWVKETLSGVGADLVLVNDLVCLPAALEARAGKVIFDAHEYAPGELSSIRFRLLHRAPIRYLCNTHMPRAAAVLTVCRTIANQYEADCGVKPVVITNAPDYEELEPSPVNATKVRLVHHGAAAPGRRLEKMVTMMDALDERFELCLMLVPSDRAYFRHIEAMAARRPRVRIIPPVPMPQISRAINQFDIGVYILDPGNFNNRFALPNKFFEFIQARLAVAVGPSPEMARIVEEHDCGIVAGDFKPETLARMLLRLDAERILHYKRRSHEAARVLSAEKNRERLLALVQSVLGA